MDRAIPKTPFFLVAVSLVLLGLPPAWTEGFKLALLGVLRPLAPASPPPPAAAPPGALPAARDEELDRLHYENLDLARKVARLTDENAQLRMKLQSLAEFRQAVPEGRPRLLDAPVLISQDPSVWRRTLLIARGAVDGVAKDDPVLWGAHFIGRVAEAGASVSRVRLMTDSGFRIAAVAASGDAARTAAERLTGVLEGQGLDTCSLNWITQDTRVEIGWPVVSAEDPLSNLPPCLILGRIADVEPQVGPFLGVRVRPALRFANLAWVQVFKGMDAGSGRRRESRP